MKCRCKTIKGVGKAHTMNCVFGPKKKTRVVKGWAVVTAEREQLLWLEDRPYIFGFKYVAVEEAEDYIDRKVVPCTITYELPAPITKNKKKQ